MPRRLKQFLPAFAIFAALAVASVFGLLRPIDRVLGDLRMASSMRDASGEIVYVAIDDRSLKEVGRWPWPRSLHATLLDRLTQAGAQDVFFDIDFAFASDPTEDAALLAALDRAGGTTYLPAFSQARELGAEGTGDQSHNLPFLPFRDLSWPALVNIPVGEGGLVRHYFFGADIDGEDTPSVAAYLSGALGHPGTQFTINFSIRPDTVPSYSALSVLDGTVPLDAFHGRSVIVGAHALELRDNLAVPVHSVVSGAMIHALAAETLLLNIAPERTSEFAAIVLLALLVFHLQRKGSSFSPWHLIARSLLVIGLAEAVGLLLFRQHALLLSTAPLYPGVLLYGVWRLAQVVDIGNWIIRRSRVEIDNTRRMLSRVFEDSSDMIVVVDAAGNVLTSSRSAVALLDRTGAENPRLPTRLAEAAQAAIDAYQVGSWVDTGMSETEIRGRIIQFSVTPSTLDELGERHGESLRQSCIATVSARDVTTMREQEKKIAYLSKHDERTGALRRPEFLDRLEAHLKSARGTTVFAFNLHRFKTINTTLGRDVGDILLRKMVARLDRQRPDLSPVVRLDGDSFAVFAIGPATDISPEIVAARIEQIVAAPYDLGDARAMVGARVGFFSTKNAARYQAPQILELAEEALEEARRFGGSSIRGHDPERARRKSRARAIEQAMWTALDAEEFNVVYQPQVDMTDGRLIGVEALVRWTSPTLGQVFPDEFIEIAESNGFIRDIGRWVLRRAAEDAKGLPAEVSVAVNVSALQMLGDGLVEDVQSALRLSGLPAQRLWLELTESVFLSPSDEMIETMRDLEMTGVSWALDDFGTGYSSLGYLAKLPLRKLKLDKSFTQALGAEPEALAILRSVAALCHGMEIGLLCEGVETAEHVRLLRAEGCVEAQGYFYARPMPIGDVIAGFCDPSGLQQGIRKGA